MIDSWKRNGLTEGTSYTWTVLSDIQDMPTVLDGSFFACLMSAEMTVWVSLLATFANIT
jgi:hypothetical protein